MSSAPVMRFSTTPMTPADTHNTTTHDRKWCIPIVHASEHAAHVRGTVVAAGLAYIYQCSKGSIFSFPLSFFQKESGKLEVGVPSFPVGGWGGDGRVHAFGVNLDLYPAGYY